MKVCFLGERSTRDHLFYFLHRVQSLCGISNPVFVHVLYLDIASSLERVENNTGFESVVRDQNVTARSHPLESTCGSNSKMQPQIRVITDLIHVVNARQCNNRQISHSHQQN